MEDALASWNAQTASSPFGVERISIIASCRLPLSANVSETLRPFAITVGRWKVTNDGRREGTHDIERASGPRRGG